MPKLTVAVLFGGRSVEHEVSVISAHQAMDALEVAGYSLLPIFIDKQGQWFAGSDLYNLKLYSTPGFQPEAQRNAHRVYLSPDPSIRQLAPHPHGSKGFFYKPPVLWADVFFPMLHGTFGEDGCLQGLLEMADVPYVGCGVLASAAGMDKIAQKRLFQQAGLPTIDCVWVARAAWKADPARFVKQVEERCCYPAIVKPSSLGSSIGIARCETSAALTQAIEAAMIYDERVLVERALTGFQEVNCSVAGPPDRASVCEMPTGGGAVLSFDDKYRRGGKGSKGGKAGLSKAGMASLHRKIPAPIPDDVTAAIRDATVRAFQAIGGHGISRVDFLLDADGRTFHVNEINTLPGSLSYYLWEASGVPFDKLATQLVEGAMERHASRRKTQFSMEVNLLTGRKP